MATINIPDGLLRPDEIKDFEDAIKVAAGEKGRTGRMTLERFIGIIKDVCSWVWNKIRGIIDDIWEGIKSIFR